MSFITKNHNQFITHWAVGATKDKFGNPVFDSPVVLKGRWEDTTELFVDIDGNERVANAKIFLGIDVVTGDYLMNRPFESGETDPTLTPGAFRIRKFMKTPGLRGNVFERVAFVV